VTPSSTTRYALQFAGDWSPWWLIALLPVLLACCWLLYRRQLADVERRPNRAGLLGVRLTLVAIVTLMVFRPNVVRRTVLRYPGRIVIVVDDSESMATRDNALTDPEALRIARGLDPNMPGDAAPAAETAESLGRAQGLVQRFAVFSREVPRTRDAFWEHADRVSQQLADVFAEAAAALPDIDAGNVERINACGAAVSVLLTGDTHPGAEAFDRACTELAAIERELLVRQAELDRAAIANGNEVLREQADSIRFLPRMDLLKRVLNDMRRELPGLSPGQTAEAVRLSDGSAIAADAPDAAELAATHSGTDIVGRVRDIVSAPSEFPISAVLVLSDGRDLGGHSVEDLTRLLVRKQVPVWSAGIGDTGEPFDVSLLSVVAPPFAVVNEDTTVRVRLKTVLPKAVAATIALKRGEDVVASAEAELGDSDVELVQLTFRPAEEGIVRYSVIVSATPGEAFPLRNNIAEFATNVRANKLTVLLLDNRPRWETRFVLNTLQRLTFVDLNALIAVVQTGGAVERGSSKGHWPESAAALGIYDLVILGDVPPGLLTPGEWHDLATYIQEGGTVCFLGAGDHACVPRDSALMPLLPVKQETGADATRARGQADLALAVPGECHPLTAALAPKLNRRAEVASAGPRAETIPLLLSGSGGRPVITVRAAGKGKTVFIGSDELWRWLNPTMLAEHRSIYLGLLQWAAEGQAATAGETAGAPRLFLNEQILHRAGPVAVWLANGTADSVVELVQGDDVVVSAAAASPWPGCELRQARFDALPSGKVAFRLRNPRECRSGSLEVVVDRPELKRLARNAAFLAGLASATNGQYSEFTDWRRFFDRFEPRERIESRERVWRLWDSRIVLALLALCLTLQWVWRKLVGLV